MMLLANKPIELFLLRTRNLLWLNKTMNLLQTGLWWAAVLALSVGFLHVFVYPMTLMIFVLLVFAPIGIAIVLGIIYHKPSLAIAAVTADHWFNGNSLMRTALDQLNKPETRLSRASYFIIEQAEQTALSWQHLLINQHRSIITKKMLVAIFIIFSGFFLLILPQQAHNQSELMPRSTADKLTSTMQNSSSTNLVADLQKVLRTQATQHKIRHTLANVNQITTVVKNKSSGGKNALPQQTAEIDSLLSTSKTTSQPQKKIRLDEQAVAVNTLSTSLHDSQKKANAPGALADTKLNPDTNMLTTKLDIELFQLLFETTSGSKANTGIGKSKELNVGKTKPEHKSIEQAHSAAKLVNSIPYSLSLTPAQKNYLARYFHRLGETP